MNYYKPFPMKKITNLLLFVFLGSGLHQSLNAQVKTMEINFKTKEVISLPESINKYDFYRLKISNINLNLYKVSIDHKDSSVNSTVEFPTFEAMGLDGLTKMLANLTPLTSISQVAKTLGKDKEKFTDLTLEQKTMEINRENGIMDKGELLTITINKNVIEEINKNIYYLQQQGYRLKKFNFSFDSLNLKVQNLYLSYFASDPAVGSLLRNNLKYSDILSTSQMYQTKIRTFIDMLEKSSLSYLDFFSKNKPVINADTSLRNTDKALKVAYAATIDSAYKMYQIFGTKNVSEWLTSIIHLENNCNTDYLSLPFQLKGDMTTLNVSIEQKKDEYGLPKYQTDLFFPTNQKMFIGTGISFYWSTLHNEAYSVKATTIDSLTTNYSIVSENSPKMEIGIATLLHFGGKVKNSNLGLSGTIGPAISISPIVKPRLTIGAGISYGKRQMVAIDFLGIGGFVDKKSEVYSVNEIYNVKPEQITVSKLSFGWGISLGYIYKF
jgi:hypothetical protein